MLDSDEGSAQAAERLRVLIPSPLGVLGLEFHDGVVGHLDIVPVGRRRASYTPFADLPRSARSEEVEEAVGRMSEYFAGARRELGIPYDLSLIDAGDFDLRVFRQTATIPYGRTRSYQEVAAAIGQPAAYRQVLSTLVGNPIPVLVPCHRVIPNRAGVGSYVASTAKKEWLLKMEKRALTGE